MEPYDDTLEYIAMGAKEIALRSLDQKKAILPDAKLDYEYIRLS
jgi:hypothetical protein